MAKKTPDQIFQEKMDFLTKAESRMKKSVSAYQSRVFELLVSEYLPLFKLKDGVILNNKANSSLIGKLDSVIDKLDSVMFKDVLSGFASDLLKSVEMSGRYYRGLGFKKQVVNNLIKNKVNLESKLGITPKGRLRKDGYLYRLGKTDAVRQQLRNYVLNSLTGDVSFLDFQLGFRNLVIGNKRVKSLPTTGSLERYFDQYAYDSFNQVDASANKQMADNLGLKHFIYEGDLIKTSRKFCEKRAGKAFTVKETKDWKNDPDLIDKKTKDSYKPLVELGRNRCRHFLKYITEDLYKKLQDNA